MGGTDAGAAAGTATGETVISFGFASEGVDGAEVAGGPLGVLELPVNIRGQRFERVRTGQPQHRTLHRRLPKCRSPIMQHGFEAERVRGVCDISKN